VKHLVNELRAALAAQDDAVAVLEILQVAEDSVAAPGVVAGEDGVATCARFRGEVVPGDDVASTPKTPTGALTPSFSITRLYFWPTRGAAGAESAPRTAGDTSGRPGIT
jgi:hypothetical protein